MKKAPILILGLFLGLTACSHYQLPVNHLDTPESRGQGQIGRFELLGLSMSNDLSASPSQGSPPAGSTTLPAPKLQVGITPSLGALIGLTDQVDVGVRLEPQAPLSFRFKYQFMGNPETKAAPQDISMAISLAPGILIGSYNGQSTTYFSGDFALLMGYRINNRNLFLITPFLTFGALSGIPLDATVAPGTLNPGVGSGSVLQYGGAVGYQYSLESIFFRGEVAYDLGTFGSSQISGVFAGALFGFTL